MEPTELADRDVCYRALRTRDARFDGRLFVGVTSTGIYCRPVCPARAPRAENCRFFRSAAAAQQAGFRPCLRCRPETAPHQGSWRGTSNTVSRALALIAAGALDRGAEGAGEEALAERVGVGARQLRRLFQHHLGATPLAVAQTRRVLFAKQLIQDTSMSMAEVAMAAGFGSVRSYNETFRALYGRPPSALRRRGLRERAARPFAEAGVSLRLRYRPPYDWEAMLAHLAERAVDGVEQVADGTYRRVVALGGCAGRLEVTHDAARACLVATIAFPSVRELPVLVAGVRRVFDLDADVEAIGRHLAGDPRLAPLVARRPGLRSPGAWDPFELAVRAVLAQEVTLVAARGLAARLAAACGEPVAVGHPSLRVAFPTPAQVARADLACLAVPRARREALRALALAAEADPDLLRPTGDLASAVARLRALRGVGEWTAQVIALRALREPDAFPAADRGLLRAAAALGVGTSPRALLGAADAWRPWRGYAAQHLWTDEHAARRVARQERSHG
jgi:AraC family transcriptional regulator of adaptative response / DNA-3-methyladenine glycosylase II